MAVGQVDTRYGVSWLTKAEEEETDDKQHDCCQDQQQWVDPQPAVLGEWLVRVLNSLDQVPKNTLLGCCPKKGAKARLHRCHFRNLFRDSSSQHQDGLDVSAKHKLRRYWRAQIPPNGDDSVC